MPAAKHPVEDHDVLNELVETPDEWQRIRIPYWAESWALQVRELQQLDWSPLAGHRRWWTLKAGYVHSEDTSPRLIWVRSSVVPVTVEVEIWGRR